MTPENFCYWLDGFFNAQIDDEEPFLGFNHDQAKQIKTKLDLIMRPVAFIGRADAKEIKFDVENGYSNAMDVLT